MCDINMTIKELENNLQLTRLCGIRCGRVKAEIKQSRWCSDKTPTQQLHFIISAPFKLNQHHYRFGFQHMWEKNLPTLMLARGVSLISQHTKTRRDSYLRSHPPGCQGDNEITGWGFFFPWCSACGICVSLLSFALAVDQIQAQRQGLMNSQPDVWHVWSITHSQTSKDLKTWINYGLGQIASYSFAVQLPEICPRLKRTRRGRFTWWLRFLKQWLRARPVRSWLMRISIQVETHDANQASVTINHVRCGHGVIPHRKNLYEHTVCCKAFM